MNEKHSCPVCHCSPTFTAFGQPTIDRAFRVVTFRVHCYGCNHEWSESYTLSGRGSATVEPVTE